MQIKNLGKGVLLFTMGMLATKLSSFFVNIALTWKYGTGDISDAIVVAISIPTIIFAGFISAVATCLVPLYKEVDLVNKSERNKLVSYTFNGLSLIVLFISVFIFIKPELFIAFLASGSNECSVQLAAKITRGVAIACIFSAGTGVLQGYLQANEKFRLVSISALPVNLILSLCIAFSQKESVAAWTSVGIVLAYLLQLVFFGVSSHLQGYRWQPALSVKDKYVKRLWIAVMPVLASILLYDINSIIDKNFASYLEAGTISVLEYSYKVAGAAQGILAYPITTILYTKLAEDSSKEDIESLRSTMSFGIDQLTLFMVPAITMLGLLANWVIEILFGRGNFDFYAIQRTAGCLIAYLIGMYAVSYRAMLEKVLYSIGRTKEVYFNVLITVIINIAMDFIGYNIWGCYGLALATSVAMIASTIYMWVLLSKKYSIKVNQATRKTIKNVTIATIIMSISILIIKTGVERIGVNSPMLKIAAMIIIVAIGLLIYYGILILKKDTYTVSFIKRLFHRE